MLISANGALHVKCFLPSYTVLQNRSKFNSFKFYLYVIRIVETSERRGEGNATPK